MLAASLAATTRSLAGSTALVGVGALFWRGAVFVLFAVIAGSLPLAQSAPLVQLLATAGAFASVAHLSSATFVARLMAQRPRPDAVIGFATLCSALFALAGAAAVTLWCMVSESHGLPGLFSGMLPVAIAAVFLLCLALAAADFVLALLYGTGRFRVALLLQVAMSACCFAAIGVIVFAPAAGVSAAIGAFVMSGVAAILAYLAVEGVPGVGLGAGRGRVLADQLGMSVPMALSALTVNPLTLAVLAHMTHFHAADRLAFLIGLNWLALAVALPGQLSTASLHYLFGVHPADRRSLMLALYGLAAAAVLAVWAVVLPLALPLASIYGPVQLEVARVASITVLAALPLCLFQIVSNQFAARGSTWSVALANAGFAAVFACALLLRRQPGFDAMALAWLLLAAHFTRFVVGFALLRLTARAG
jgi:hypothetical protein